MRISDWSSDVCSSDLLPEAQPFAAQIVDAANTSFVSGMHLAFTIAAGVTGVAALCVARFLPARAREELQIGRASCRERVSVRVDLVGRRHIKKNTKQKLISKQSRKSTDSTHRP